MRQVNNLELLHRGVADHPDATVSNFILTDVQHLEILQIIGLCERHPLDSILRDVIGLQP